jgi:hypothetical protein
LIYRNPKLLQAAKYAPHCMVQRCKAENYGQIVAAHSNYVRHGKGKGIKAHDVPAYVCNGCHDVIDGRVTIMSKEEREQMFLDAVYFSIVWLLQSGRLITK